MDYDRILNNIFAGLLKEAKPPKRLPRPARPIRRTIRQVHPKAPVIPDLEVPKAKPAQPTTIKPKTQIEPYKRPELNVTFDSKGQPKIPKAWFDRHGNLKPGLTKEHLDKAVENGRIHHRAAQRLPAARKSAKQAANKITSAYPRDVRALGMSFAAPGTSTKAIAGIVTTGILGGLFYVMFGRPPQSSDPNIQLAINNGIKPLGQPDEPLVSTAIQDIQELAKQLLILHKLGQVTSDIVPNVQALIAVHRFLSKYKSEGFNSTESIQNFASKTVELSPMLLAASDGLDKLKDQVKNPEVLEEINALSGTLSAMAIVINNARTA
jgi:hypothetical protein